MNKGSTGIISCTSSLVLTFLIFHFCSWYNFGDIPTPVVAIRLIIFWIMLSIIIFELAVSVIAHKKK